METDPGGLASQLAFTERLSLKMFNDLVHAEMAAWAPPDDGPVPC